MRSEFEIFADEFAVPALMEQFGGKGLLRIVPDGQIEGSTVDAIIGNVRVERMADTEYGERVIETRTIHAPLSVMKLLSMDVEVYVAFDPDPWSLSAMLDSSGPIVSFDLQRRYTADRSRSNREET